LAALRQVDGFGLANQLGGEVIDPGANQIRALAQCPSMTLMEAEVFWNLVASNAGLSRTKSKNSIVVPTRLANKTWRGVRCAH
jgi:hypothetical protein